MSETVEYGRLWFSPWLMNDSMVKTIDRMSRGLGFGAEPEVTVTTGKWIEIYAVGPAVEGLLVDADGLIADLDDVMDILGPLFDQNVPLTCRGIRYSETAIITSMMTMNRVGNVLSCSLERVRTTLSSGLREVLLNQSAEIGKHANVIPLRASRL